MKEKWLNKQTEQWTRDNHNYAITNPWITNTASVPQKESCLPKKNSTKRVSIYCDTSIKENNLLSWF